MGTINTSVCAVGTAFQLPASEWLPPVFNQLLYLQYKESGSSLTHRQIVPPAEWWSLSHATPNLQPTAFCLSQAWPPSTAALCHHCFITINSPFISSCCVCVTFGNSNHQMLKKYWRTFAALNLLKFSWIHSINLLHFHFSHYLPIKRHVKLCVCNEPMFLDLCVLIDAAWLCGPEGSHEWSQVAGLSARPRPAGRARCPYSTRSLPATSPSSSCRCQEQQLRAAEFGSEANHVDLEPPSAPSAIL